MTDKLTYDPGTHFIQRNQHSIAPLVEQLNKDLKQTRVFSAAFDHIFSDKNYQKKIEVYESYNSVVTRLKKLRISDATLLNVARNGHNKKDFPSLSDKAHKFFDENQQVIRALVSLVLDRLTMLEGQASKARTHLVPTLIVNLKDQAPLLNNKVMASKDHSIPIFFFVNQKKSRYWKKIDEIAGTKKGQALHTYSVNPKYKPIEKIKGAFYQLKTSLISFAICVVDRKTKLPDLLKSHCFPLDIRGKSLLAHLSKQPPIFQRLLKNYRTWVARTTEKDSVLFFHQVCRIRDLAENILSLEDTFIGTRGLPNRPRPTTDNEIGEQQVKLVTGDFQTQTVRERTHTIGDDGHAQRDELLYRLQRLIHRIDVLSGLKEKFTGVESGILTSLKLYQKGIQTYLSQLYTQTQIKVPMSPRR